MKHQILLICAAAFLVSVDASHDSFEQQRIDRHIEIRRELETEATPFLEEGFGINIPVPDKGIIEHPIQTKKLTFLQNLGDYSAMDLIASLFSVLALGFGLGFLLWKNNPFLGKSIK